jgi:hypothetical protein
MCNASTAEVVGNDTRYQKVFASVCKYMHAPVMITFAIGHNVSTFWEWTCAVNSGKYACSETSLTTVKI